MPDKTEAQGTPEPTPAFPEPEPSDLTGKVLGDFRILHRLGQGGMGQVYKARQVSLNRDVALKFLKPELAGSKTSLERFKREALAVARTSHANIVQIYFIGEADGMPYMALEYVDGRNLREFIEKKGPPELHLGLRIMSQIALALQQAGELGIVHRDIKPENILINRRGDVKVTDFGLMRERRSNLTESKIAMGTPLYMSPEQVEGKPVDPRTDLYSFGATSYHLFAGHPPFKGQTPFEVALQHVNKEPAPLAEIRPDLPADLCLLIHRLLAKRPEQRYQSAREVVRDLGRLRDALVATGGSLSAPVLTGLTPSGGVPSFGSTELDTVSGPYVSRPGRRRRRWQLAAVVAVALTAGAAAGWWLTPPPSVLVAPPIEAADGKPPQLPQAVKELFSAEEREKDLARRAQEYLKAPTPLAAGPGLETVMDLGALYLRERRWDDAEKLFKELDQPDRKRLLGSGGILSHLGRAIVLAFRDQSADSNRLFVTTLDDIARSAEKLEAASKVIESKTGKRLPQLNFWRAHVSWMELIAQALDRNYANDPEGFPKDARLEVLRKPPGPGAALNAAMP